MPDPLAVMTGRRVCRSPGISWISLRSGDTTAVKRARQFIADVISLYVHDADHVHTVQWAASEALANAVAAADDYAERLGIEWSYFESPVRLGVACTRRWVRLDVRDPDPVMHEPAPETEPHDPLDEHGRGLAILNELAVRVWHTPTPYDKVVHIVIAAPGVTLTDDELARASW